VEREGHLKSSLLPKATEPHKARDKRRFCFGGLPCSLRQQGHPPFFVSFFFNISWDFRIENIKYCVNDSKLLLGVMNKFARLIYDRFKLNLINYPTLPGLAFAIFRAIYQPCLSSLP
jgi:hypothetical protein